MAIVSSTKPKSSKAELEKMWGTGTTVNKATATGGKTTTTPTTTVPTTTTPTSGYTPLDVSGNDYAGMKNMDDVDRAAMEAAQNSWNAANQRGDKVGMDAAHQQAEAIRQKYGYSGGTDGSQYVPIQGFTYANSTEWVNENQGRIDSALNDLLSRDSFSYDLESDPLYQQYKESYTRSGQRAMQDALGALSTRTGGLASSYAATASQQAYDEYMDALLARVPELQQLAYSMYQDEGTQQMNNLQLLMGERDFDYNQYLNGLTQYNTDRNFDYGAYRDQIADQRYDQEWDYQVGRDEQADAADDWERQYTSAATLAGYGDFSALGNLFGWEESQVQQAVSQYAKEQALSDRDAAMELAEFVAGFRAQYGYVPDLGTTLAATSATPVTLSSVGGGGSSGTTQRTTTSGGSGSSNTSADNSAYNSIYVNARRRFDNGASMQELLSYLQQSVNRGAISQGGADDIINKLGLQ